MTDAYICRGNVEYAIMKFLNLSEHYVHGFEFTSRAKFAFRLFCVYTTACGSKSY